MKVFECKMCGGKLPAQEGQSVCTCDFCGTTQPIAIVNEERIVNLFNKANKYRKETRFDQAMTTYENILDEDNTIAEAHWGIVLCRYGVEYVKDADGQMVATCHRAQYNSILADPNYKETLANADPMARFVYEGEARTIAVIQKHIIEVSAKAKPYDIFICYKEKDAFGERTEDSSIAQDICTYLTSEGLRVFYARITLATMAAGSEYEPYIFAALNSAKVMIVIGTKEEYLNAPWVRNEWGRFLGIAREKKDRILLPCIKYMQPENLPPEFSNCEALDVASPAFMLNLINKVRDVTRKKETPQSTQVVNSVENTMSGNAAALAKRGYIYLEDGEFQEARDCFNKSLDLRPDEATTYWGLLLASEKCRNNDQLIKKGFPIERSKEYQKARRFANGDVATEYDRVVSEIHKHIKTTIKKLESKEMEEVDCTGVSRVLSECTHKKQASAAAIDRLVGELFQIEHQYQQCAAACQNDLQASRNNVGSYIQQTRTLKADLAKAYQLTGSEKSKMLERIKELNGSISAESTKIVKITQESPNFKYLQTLLQNHGRVVSEIEKEQDYLEEITEKLNLLQKRILEIHKKYDQIYEEVRNGKYEKANTVLSTKRDVFIDSSWDAQQKEPVAAK